MEVIYSGLFYSRENVKWEVRILRKDALEPSSGVGELRFCGDEPLLIEWDERSKEEVLCGSIATLRLLSPGDRTYIDLYSVAVGEIRLDVLRDGVLYWSGTLDPEFYEEPYSTLSDYEVSLTFSDFGILERLRFDLSGMLTLRELLDNALERSGVNYVRVDEGYISTSLDGGKSVMSLGDLTVRCDNFYDEDGEALTLREVLEGIFQPLGLRMVQRGGVVWVYDLNGLYAGGALERVEWMSDDQMLGVDAVYNNAKVTWSPYAQSGVLTEEECYVDDTDPNLTALNISGGRKKGNSTYYSYHYSQELENWIDATDCGFTLWTSPKGKNATIFPDLRFFKIVPQEDGQKSEGIAVMWTNVWGLKQGTSVKFSWKKNGFQWGFCDSVDEVGFVLWKSQEIWLPPVTHPETLRLRIGLEMLMDCRFNPFESGANLMKDVEQKDWEDQWNSRGNFVYVPVTLKFQPDGTDEIYCWTNQYVPTRDISDPVCSVSETMGRWMEYGYVDLNDENPAIYGYLCWYDGEDRTAKSGVLGWKKNRPCINPHKERFSTALAGMSDGQPVPYPNIDGRGGRLWLEVRSDGWMLSDGDVNLSMMEFVDSHGLWTQGKTWWCLMKLPEIEVLNNQQFDATIDTDDVEYSAVLNPSAKDDIEIETICGTASGGIPMARGAYFKDEGLTQVETLTRAGRTAQAEELLIGTLYSQFAARRTKLEGTTRLGPPGLCLWCEAMQGDCRFIDMSVTENIQDDSCERVLVELRPDEYDKAK